MSMRGNHLASSVTQGMNTMHMVFEGELAVKLHAKDVKVGTSSDRNPQARLGHHGWTHGHGSTMTTKALVLLGFSIMHQ